MTDHDQELYRQLGVIQGKLDATLSEVSRLNTLIISERKETKELMGKLSARVTKIELDQVRQNTVTVTLAGIVSLAVMIAGTLVDWGAKLFK